MKRRPSPRRCSTIRRPSIRMIPTAVFSDPEIGTVGLSEEAAREMGHVVDIYKIAFWLLRYTLAGRDDADADEARGRHGVRQGAGRHILGPDAAEIVQMAAIALKMGATKAQFDMTMALHRSAAEEARHAPGTNGKAPTPMAGSDAAARGQDRAVTGAGAGIGNALSPRPSPAKALKWWWPTATARRRARSPTPSPQDQWFGTGRDRRCDRDGASEGADGPLG